jgi:hypothetical protein
MVPYFRIWSTENPDEIVEGELYAELDQFFEVKLFMGGS